jgi:hypothetical protein
MGFGKKFGFAKLCLTPSVVCHGRLPFLCLPAKSTPGFFAKFQFLIVSLLNILALICDLVIRCDATS